MMKNLFQSFLLLAALPLSAQSGWVRHFAVADSLISVQPLPDGGYAMLLNNAQQVYQIRTDSLGWPLDTVFLGPIPADIVPAANGGFLTCRVQNTHLKLQKLDGTGAMLWEQLLTDTFPQRTPVLTPLPDGGCYVVSTNGPTTPPSYRQTLVQRLDAAGNRLWLLHTDSIFGWGFNGYRNIADAAVLPDGSCVVASADSWEGAHGAGHLLRVSPEGVKMYSRDFAPDWTYATSGETRMVRPTVDSLVFVSGLKRATGGPAHPAISTTGFSSAVDENGKLVSGADFPPTNFQMGAVYGPTPVAAAPLAAGDMLVLGQINTDAFLWRVSYDLNEVAWQQPLNVNASLQAGRIKRPNRIIHATADQGAVFGWAAYNGIYLQKIGLWGNDSTATYYPVKVNARRDTDQDCQSEGPFETLPFARVRFTPLDTSGLSWTGRADANGEMFCYLPSGYWRIEQADSVASFFGRNCQVDTVLHVTDSLPLATANFSVLRYTARLSGQIWRDDNGNCTTDEPNFGFYANARRVRIMRAGQFVEVEADDNGFYQTSLDTGWYRLQVYNYRAGPLRGYYCSIDSVYLPGYQSADTLNLLWSQFQNARLKIKALRDGNYDCQPGSGDFNWPGFDLRVADPDLPNQWQSAEAGSSGWAEVALLGPGKLWVDTWNNFPDSLLCGTVAPHEIVVAGADDQIVNDTFLARYPRWGDTLYVCAGAVLWGVPVWDTTVIVQPAVFLNEFQTPFNHHVFPWPVYYTELYEPLPPGQTDTLSIQYLTTVHGCDSVIAIHYTTLSYEPRFADLIRMTPNPAHSRVELEWPAGKVAALILTDVQGRIVLREEGLDERTFVRIDVAVWPAGVYGCLARLTDGRAVFSPLVVRR